MSKKYREQTVTIKLSTTVLQRTVCKYCGSPPTEYYYVGTPVLYKEARNFVELFAWVQKRHKKRFCSSYYLMCEPIEFSNINQFSFCPDFNSYNPRLHNKVGVKATRNIKDCLVCECGKTSWVIANKSMLNRPEICNRKSDREYPKKFKY